MKLLGLIFFIAFLLGFSNCGYRLKHNLQDAFNAPNGVFVPVFDNATDEIGVERIFTNALIRELASRHELVLSSRKESALILKGNIISISYNPTAHTVADYEGLRSYRQIPTELGVEVVLSLSLSNPKTHRILWSKSFRGFRRLDAPKERTYNYQASSSIGLTTMSLVGSIFPAIARDIMRDVYDEMVELF